MTDPTILSRGELCELNSWYTNLPLTLDGRQIGDNMLIYDRNGDLALVNVSASGEFEVSSGYVIDAINNFDRLVDTALHLYDQLEALQRERGI